ncbi:cupin domain-containing protein [Virgibacillus sp. MSP4-1]|nr:cupin domain-containing protein [Virgibacillus sp. MSP4-1]
MNPYNAGASYYSAGYRDNSKLLNDILDGLNKEATAADLYSRLAAGTQEFRSQNDLIQALEVKNRHLQQLTQLYASLTGTYPVYNYSRIPFHHYEEGLQRAVESEQMAYESYQTSTSQSQDPYVRDLFIHLLTQQEEQLNRFGEIRGETAHLKDYGSQPFVINIDEATTANNTYRTALWTGEHLQVTLMSIDVGDDIGLEVHPNTDQFIRLEQGQGLVQMGDSRDNLTFEARAYDDFAVMIPAGKWHNITNTGDVPMKVYAIYAPPEHPFGTVHRTKADAMEA